jgi:hypothetical protein
MQSKRSLAPLTGALFVVLTAIAFIPLGGNTPEGDDPAQKVVTFYTAHESKEIFAAVVLAAAAVALLFFAATLKQRLEAAEPGSGSGILPTATFGAGVIGATGFLTAAALHFALADYAGDIGPVAAQALNAIDSDFFFPFAIGIAALVFSTSLWVLRSRTLFPTWLGWVGIVLFIVNFTPVGFVAFGLAGIWIIVLSVMLYLRGEQAGTGTPSGAPQT